MSLVRPVLFLAVLLAIVVAPAATGQNPFAPGRPPEPQLYSGRVPSFILEWSHYLQGVISRFSRRISDEGGGLYGLVAFFAAVLFGMVHVAGPGHGKIFTLTYFSARQSRLRDGILLAGMINVVDSVSAGVLVFVGYGLLTVVFTQFQGDATRYAQLISYGAVTVFGVVHLIQHIRGRCDEHAHHEEAGRPVSRRTQWVFALSVGLIPCPVSTMLLVFGLANGILLFSGVLVLGVSLGGFITMALLSIAIIGGKKGLASVLRGSSRERVLHVLELVFSSLLVVFGALMLFAAVF